MSDTEYIDDSNFPQDYEKFLEQNAPLFSGPEFDPNNKLTNSEGEELISDPSFSSFLEQESITKIIELDFTTDGDISIFDDYKPRVTETSTDDGTDFPDRKEYFVIEKDDYPGKGTTAPELFTEMESESLVQLSWGEIDSNGVIQIYYSDVPLRFVTVSRSYTKISNTKAYFLTDEEAAQLKNDIRVKSVEIPPEQDGCEISTDAYQPGNFTRTATGTDNPNDLITVIVNPFPNHQGYTNNIDFIPGEEVIQVLNSGPDNIPYNSATAKGTILSWSDGKSINIYGQTAWYLWPLLNIQNYTGEFIGSTELVPQYIKGVTSGAIFKIYYYGVGKHLQQNSNWGMVRSNAIGNSGDPIPPRYDYTLDGTGVDVVIIDTGIYTAHPEFQDADGNSRIVQHNWYVAAGRPAEANKQHERFYTDQNGHGTHVAGTVAGKTFGWAKNARIYSMAIMGPYKISYDDAFDLIAEWHLRKPIETETGVRRPTIVNCSWSWSRLLGFGPPMIAGQTFAGCQNCSPSVWNPETPSCSIASVNIAGTTYDKNNIPPSGNVEDEERPDFFNTGPKVYNGQTLQANFGSSAKELKNISRLFSTTKDVLGYTFGADQFNRYAVFDRARVNAFVGVVDSGIQTMIDAGIHVCIAAGNDSRYVAAEGDVNYNNYATFQTYPNTSGFFTIGTNGWELGPTTGYSQPNIRSVDIHKKTSPYATDAIIVGSISSTIIKQGTNTNNIFLIDSQNLYENPVVTTNISGREYKSSFSNFGSGIDIYAPGSHIISCAPNYWGLTNGVRSPRIIGSDVPDYTHYCVTEYKVQPYYFDNNYSQVKLSGTSMASPQVCGFGALLLQLYPQLSPYELKYLIKGLANKVSSFYGPFEGYVGDIDKWGRGVLFCSGSYGVCAEDREAAVRSFQQFTNGTLFSGTGNVGTINILHNPYSETLPTNTDIIIARILAAQNPPELVSVTNGYSFLRIMWNEVLVEDLVGYIVERSLSENGTYTALFSTPITGRKFDDYTAEPNIPYYYRVYSVGENSTTSPRSSIRSGVRVPVREILVTSTPVIGLRAEATSVGIKLTWDATLAQDHSYYEVRRSTSIDGTFTKINLRDLERTEFLDSNVSPQVRYYYIVYSANYNRQYSPKSDIVSAVGQGLIVNPPIQPPGGPEDGGEQPPTEPGTELGTEPGTEPKGPVISPWVAKGNVIKTIFTSPGIIGTDGTEVVGTEDVIDVLRLSNTSWVQTDVSTTNLENIRLQFSFRTNNFKNNEFLGVFYYDNMDWKLAFIGRGEDFKEFEVPFEESATNKGKLTIRFHAFTTFQADDKWAEFGEVSLFGNEIN